METVKSPAEQKVLLNNVSWETYESLLEDHWDSSGPRFTFDRGMLEIMSPSPEHEAYNRSIALLVEFVAEKLGIDVYNLGSTTFRREDLERGFEPDSCFYIRNEEQVRGKDRIDLDVDPPPDLVIEVDITSPSTNKLPIYAQLGVPEVWRYDGEKLEILKLENGGYAESPESVALPALTSSTLSQLMGRSKSLRRTVWLREVRRKARELYD
ncbi:Uma2 family endonuclease [soil metagenome]